MKIAIIGGGIGGLSAALHLLKAGLDVHVYEQSPRIGEIGAGIQISPNASRLLVRLIEARDGQSRRATARRAPAPLVDGERPHAHRIQPRLEAETDQEARGIGADLDAGADVADAR